MYLGFDLIRHFYFLVVTKHKRRKLNEKIACLKVHKEDLVHFNPIIPIVVCFLRLRRRKIIPIQYYSRSIQ